jgi:formate/nitrite transporter FocA (FNT family)
MVRNWGWVYLGNLVGSVGYALLFTGVLTTFGADDGGRVAEVIRELAVRKTSTYSAAGAAGWAAALASGVLANWLVTVGTVLAFASSATGGKVVAMWLPIMVFFALGFEHSVVNMYAMPAGMLLGAPVGLADWWLWNQVPVTVGNVLGGGVCTGLALHALCRPPSPR